MEARNSLISFGWKLFAQKMKKRNQLTSAFHDIFRKNDG
jgi:hypothetical protein